MSVFVDAVNERQKPQHESPMIPPAWHDADLAHASDSTGNDGGDTEWVVGQAGTNSSRWLIWIAIVAIVALVCWMGVSLIDEVVRGEGKVVPSRQVQVVQSLDGGVVKEILVKPGQTVEPGQTLLKVDPIRFNSSLASNQVEYLSLLAKAARLRALGSGEPFQAPDEVVERLPAAAESERNVWIQRVNELNATIGVIQEQVKQRQEELRETQAKRDQSATACVLTSKELAMNRPLLASGAVSEVEVMRLQRDVAKSCGDQKAAEAQIDRTEASIQEAVRKAQEAELNVRNQARSELSDTDTKLRTLHEDKLALADKVRLAEIRSPVRGTVKTLMANTVGGVLQPGKDIIEIVPTDDTLLLEVRVPPRDIGFLHAEQKAQVKFTAYDYSVYGGLDGVVEQIGADTIIDERGNAYYVVRVRTAHNTVGEKQLPIIPGMVAEVHILTGKRTVLQYLLKPILRAKENAFTER